MEWHCYTATLAVMTNVRGTGWDWPRNKFSLPSGARGRRKHTRLPKIKDRDHFREESTSANRRAKNTRRELRGVAASSSRTPTIENQAQPRKIKRPSRRSNMEIGRARTPRRISSNASQITPPANKSTKRSGMKILSHHDRMHETRSNEALTVVDRASQVPLDSVRSSQKVMRTKDANKLQALMKLPGWMQHDKGCDRSKRKRVLAPKNKLRHDS